MTRRENRRHRPAPFREEAPQILVACGGKTEAQYFKQLREHYRNPAVRIDVRSDDADPCNLIRYASTVRGREHFDDVWCVTDVDQFRVASAVDIAKRKNIRLAVSNPCFEYWLLLHHVDCDAPLARYEDVDPRVRRYVPTYDKSRLNLADFCGGIDLAVARAKARCPEAEAACRINPSSGVWALMERIRRHA